MGPRELSLFTVIYSLRVDAAAGGGLAAQSCPTLGPVGLWPARLLCPRDSPGKSTGGVAISFSNA